MLKSDKSADTFQAVGDVQLNAINMEGQAQLQANLQGRIGADTQLTPECRITLMRY